MRSEALAPRGRRDRARALAQRAAVAGLAAACVGMGLLATPAGASTSGSGDNGASPADASSAGSGGGSGGGGGAGYTGGYVTPTTSPGEAQVRAEAAQLTQQIQTQGQHLDQLAEAFNGAQIHLTQVTAQVHSAQQAVAATGRKVTAAAAEVRNQAVAAYVGQPQPSLAGLKLDPNEGDAVATDYIESVGDVEKQSIDRLKDLRHQQSQQLAGLHRQQQQAQHALSTLQADRNQAANAQAAQEALLSRVQGQLAVYVAADQRQQQQAAEAVLASEQRAATTTTTATPTTAATTQPPATAAPSTAAVAAARPPAAAPTAAPTTAYVPPASAYVAPTTAYVPPTTRYIPPTTQYVPPPTTAPPAPPVPSGPPPGASAAIAFAESQIGKPYSFGGAGYPPGWDCSGLVMVAYEQAGIYFPHYAESQYADTIHIPISQLQPGDLVFFLDGGQMDHVGIYIGGGQMVDAPSTGHDVRIESIYWSNLAAAGRVR